MTDLISREAAIATIEDIWHDFAPYEDTVAAIRALPAVQPDTPTQLTYEARLAIDGEGPRAYDWFEKPHRIVYDLCREIEKRAVQPDAAAIKSAAFQIAVLMELHAATGSTTKAKAEDIERGIRALIDNPGKEVMPDASSDRSSDTAPAGLSAGGGADWQPIETAPKDRSSFIGYWRRQRRSDCEVKTWWCDIDERWESPFETTSNDSEPTHWMPRLTPPATDGRA